MNIFVRSLMGLTLGCIVVSCFGSDTVAKDSKRLWGIAEVKLNKDGSVTLFDATEGDGHAMMFSLSTIVKSVTLKPGESCSLTDGDHATITYTLKKADGNQLTFHIKDRFDARSFGDGIKVKEKTITIAPYGVSTTPKKGEKPVN